MFFSSIVFTLHRSMTHVKDCGGVIEGDGGDTLGGVSVNGGADGCGGSGADGYFVLYFVCIVLYLYLNLNKNNFKFQIKIIKFYFDRDVRINFIEL
jgi:hypothetical protein